ncbi:hypothetical protein NX059_001751 [Plenodomus lindquistii]|nr:hypothetical protein NX059_001751 [Plenodomus lindquistii]
MSPPRNKVTNDSLRRFILETVRIRRMEPVGKGSSNPLDAYINERTPPRENDSKVGQLVDIFESKMNWQKRWDGWYWSAPVYEDFGIIADVELKKRGEWKFGSEDEEEMSSECSGSDIKRK